MQKKVAVVSVSGRFSSCECRGVAVKAETVGAVYTMTNDPPQLRPGLRPRCGWQLDGRGDVPTGGLGTGGREPDFGSVTPAPWSSATTNSCCSRSIRAAMMSPLAVTRSGLHLARSGQLPAAPADQLTVRGRYVRAELPPMTQQHR